MKKRNILFNLLVFGILILGLHINANAQETSVPDGYTGIYNIADLDGIRNDPSGNYILMKDIDMTEDTKKGGDWDSGMGWTPIEEFSGVLDGNGYQIIGMNIYTTRDTSNEYIGLIGKLEGGVIENLALKNITIDIVGKNIKKAGSIAGYSMNGTIKNCYSSGAINAGGEKGDSPLGVGAMVGITQGGSIKDCFSMVDISAGKTDRWVGATGITTRDGSIYDYNGLSIVNCYSRGTITGTNTAYAISNNNMKNCFYLKGSVEQYADVTEANPLTDTQMKYAQVFTNFDFENTWEIDSYSNYPYPQLRSNPYIRVTKLQLISMPSKTVYQQGASLN